MVRVKCLATLYLLMILPARSPIFPASAARSRPRGPSTLALTLASSTSVAANSSVRLRARSAATAGLRQIARVHQRADLHALERADEVHALLLEAHSVRLGDHPAVADEADVLDLKPLTHRGDGVGNGLLVGDVALMHAHRDWASVRAADQPVVDLQLALHAIARVAQRRQRTTATLHITRGQVIEHERVTVPVAG